MNALVRALLLVLMLGVATGLMTSIGLLSIEHDLEDRAAIFGAMRLSLLILFLASLLLILAAMIAMVFS